MNLVDGKICILLVDDEERIVRALSDYFKANGFAVLKAFDGEAALDTYYKNNSEIDLIILDVMMPKTSGFEVLRELRSSSQAVPIIMLTARSEEYDQISGLDCGADDYIPKPVSPSLLLARVQAVLRRVGKSASEKLCFGNISVDRNTHTVFDCGQEIELTKREFDLLCYLIMNERITLSREKLLNNVWGYDYFGDERTVDTHIKQLRAKLKSGNYIKTVYKVGYKFED